MFNIATLLSRPYCAAMASALIEFIIEEKLVSGFKSKVSSLTVAAALECSNRTKATIQVS